MDFGPQPLTTLAERPTPAEMEAAVRTLILGIGENPDREGLLQTPARVVRAYNEWFAGYNLDPTAVLARSFEDTEGYDDTVVLRDIPLVSTCEHHMAAITGVVHIAYRPAGRVVGVSKLARLVDVFGRRLQIQERMTRQLALTLEGALEPKGVGVIVAARHACMTTRGVNHPNALMVTRCWRGAFKTDPALRLEAFGAEYGGSTGVA
ncbi:GTP cyclohydrolase I FolE [Phenylobacterium sp.]|uniref:GTP cyclohydrolase I FolE n=1 Tax=Phenylobacterium sp. TaxID=1871053 RepID=UPI003BAB0B81